MQEETSDGSTDVVLLSVDAGLRCGLAGFGRDGKLLWCRSRNFGTHTRLKRRVRSLLAELPVLQFMVLEGGGATARPWSAEGRRRGITVFEISAEKWRDALLRPRDRRTGPLAKETATILARRVIEWSEIPKPSTLIHDAAEAVLAGLWGVHAAGLISDFPNFISG